MDEAAAGDGQTWLTVLWDRVGGVTGALLTAAPTVGFVLGNLIAGLWPAIWSAVAVALVTSFVQLRRGVKPLTASAGLGLTIVASVIAAFTGTAKGYYLWGMASAGIGGLVLIVSVFARRPLLGMFWAGIRRQDRRWRFDPRCRFYYNVVTGTYGVIALVQFSVQLWLYRQDATTWLGITKIVIGWSSTPITVLLLLWASRRVEARLAQTRGAELQPV